MDTLSPTAARPPSLLDLAQPSGATPTGARHWTGRAQNFAVAWHHAGTAGSSAQSESADETLLIVLDAPVAISGAASRAEAPARSICILPPGAWQLDLRPGATCAVLTSLREGVAAGALNEPAYAQRDPRIAPVGPPWRALRGAGEVRILSIDSIAAPEDKPRLKMLQTATLSINWVEYEGPRDRHALSPHSHTSFEQGSLALAGDFVHHLRVDWGPDADAWQDDQHARLGSPSLMVVPVHTIHTSEGVGPGRHLLIDVFSPPRADFIAKGWVANSGDYAAPETAAA
jgi:hypothetical protein